MRRWIAATGGLLALIFGAQAATAGSALAAQGWTAFVGNFSSHTVTELNTASAQLLGVPITITGPTGMAITPDGRTAYVVDENGNTVTPIDVATDTAGTAITVGPNPGHIAITPDGTTAYVVNGNGTVTPIDLATQTAETAINVGTVLAGIAITPDGRTAYVTDNAGDAVVPIDVTTNAAGTAIQLPPNAAPAGIAITPDGGTAYVAEFDRSAVTPITTATGVPGSEIPVGSAPVGVAISPNGRTAYVTNSFSNTVTPIDTMTNAAGTAINVGGSPEGIAIAPDGKTAYAVDETDNTLTPIDTATNSPGAVIPVGGVEPNTMTIAPDQAPTAAFSATAADAGRPSIFDGSASSSPVGSIVSYHWDFGDGQSATITGTSLAAHIYAQPGSYTARLTVTNTAGTSTTQVFTGQTVSQNGGPSATTTQTATVVPTPAPVTTTTPPLPTTTPSPPPPIATPPIARVATLTGLRATLSGRGPLVVRVRYALSSPATVILRLVRRAPGRSARGRCVAVTHDNAGHPRCTRLIRVPGHFSRTRDAGTSRSAQISGRNLRPGTYELTATPTGGIPHTTTFTIPASPMGAR